MTSSVTKLPDEPIVIVTIRLPIHENLEDVAVLNEQVAQIISASQDPVIYRISDASFLDDVSFSDVLLWLGEQHAHRAGSVLDPRVKPIGAGTNRMVQIAARKLAEQTRIIMPLFDTLEEAIAFARAQIAQHAAR